MAFAVDLEKIKVECSAYFPYVLLLQSASDGRRASGRTCVKIEMKTEITLAFIIVDKTTGFRRIIAFAHSQKQRHYQNGPENDF